MLTTIPLEPRKIPKQRRSKELVEALLDATARVLVEDGWDQASTNRIAEVAGVSVGSLYQYFPNRESLAMALARRHADEVFELLQNAVVELAFLPPEQAVRRFLRAMIDAHCVDPELHIALTHQVLALGLEGMDGPRERARQLVVAWMSSHPDLEVDDPEIAGWLLVTTAEAAIHGALIDHQGPDVSSPAFQDQLTTLILRYLRLEGTGAPGAR